MCSSCSRCFRRESNMECPILSISPAFLQESSRRTLCSSNTEELSGWGEYFSLAPLNKASRADEDEIWSVNPYRVPSSISCKKNGFLLFLRRPYMMKRKKVATVSKFWILFWKVDISSWQRSRMPCGNVREEASACICWSYVRKMKAYNILCLFESLQVWGWGLFQRK